MIKNLFNIFLFISFLLQSFSFASEQENLITSEKIYLKYEQYPQRVFTSQQFNITLKAVILENNSSYDSIVTTFSNSQNINILTSKPIWKMNKTNQFYTQLTFKANNQNFKMPHITIALKKGDQLTYFKSLDPVKIEFEQIAINAELFSNIIAKELEILSINTKQYTNNLLINTIHIEASNSNLENFHLKKFKDQGIKHFNSQDQIKSFYYYVVTPTHKEKISFTYYNTSIKDFIKIDIPITLQEDLVSTQTDLNPYDNSFTIYKQGLVAVFIIIFLLLFIFKKNNIYLALTLIFILIESYFFIPNKKIIINSDTKIYILPTKNATVFHITEQKKLVEIVDQKDDFDKIIFDKNKIGWIEKR